MGHGAWGLCGGACMHPSPVCGVGRMQEAERQRAKRAKHLQICKQRYGDNWREAMLMDTQVGDDDLKEMFDMVDDDNSGYLDRDEIETLIDFFGADGQMTTKEEIDLAMAQMDHANCGEVDFASFTLWWKSGKGLGGAGSPRAGGASRADDAGTADGARGATGKKQALKGSARLARTHTSIDYEGNLQAIFKRYAEVSAGENEIDAAGLQKVMQSLGHTISLEQADEMVNEIDEDGSGTIDLQEFMNMFEGSGKGGGGLVDVLREASFSSFEKAERDMWARGMFLRFRSGEYRPVFSMEARKKAITMGAEDTGTVDPRVKQKAG